MNKAIVGILGAVVGAAGGYFVQDANVKKVMDEVTTLTEKASGLEGMVGEAKTAGEAALADAQAALEAAKAEAQSALEAAQAETESCQSCCRGSCRSTGRC